MSYSSISFFRHAMIQPFQPFVAFTLLLEVWEGKSAYIAFAAYETCAIKSRNERLFAFLCLVPHSQAKSRYMLLSTLKSYSSSYFSPLSGTVRVSGTHCRGKQTISGTHAAISSVIRCFVGFPGQLVVFESVVSCYGAIPDTIPKLLRYYST